MEFLKVIYLRKSDYWIIEETPPLIVFVTYLGNLLNKQLQRACRSGQVINAIFTNLLFTLAVSGITINALVFITGQEIRQELAVLSFSLMSSFFELILAFSGGKLWLM